MASSPYSELESSGSLLHQAGARQRGAALISLPTGDRLQRLSGHFELVWASGWEDKANFYLPAMLGLPELPHLTFGGSVSAGAAHWKLGPLAEYASDRPLAWIDDNFNESCYEWAERRAAPTLLVPTESHLGLEEAHRRPRSLGPN